MTLTRGYDAAGCAQGLSLWADGSFYLNGTPGAWAGWQGWDYDPNTGRVAGLSMPEGHMALGCTAGVPLAGAWTLNGARMARVADGLGRTTSVAGSVGAEAAEARTYTYDTHNRRDKLEDEMGRAWKYDYDGRGQVIKGEKKLGTDLPV